MIISSLKIPSVHPTLGWTVFHLKMLKYIENKHISLDLKVATWALKLSSELDVATCLFG